MSYSSRFWLYAPLCLFLALAAGVGVHWWRVASAFDSKLDALKGREAVPGIVIDWQSKTLSGFPFNLDLVLTGLSIKGAGAHGPFAWSSEKFALHALTYGRNKQVMEAGGQQELRWTDANGGSHSLSFLPAELHASSVLDGRGLVRFDLDILDAGGKDTGGHGFVAGRLQLHLRRDPKGQLLDLAASADGVSNEAGMPPFGRQIGSLRVSRYVNHAERLAPLLRGEMSWPAADAAWHKPDANASLDTSQSVNPEQSRALGILLSALY